MKKNTSIRQNQRVAKHTNTRKLRIPEPKRRAAKTWGKILPGYKPVREMLKVVEKEYLRGKDEKGNSFALDKDEVDWDAVRAEVEARLRKIPDILPKQMMAYQQIAEYQKKMPRKVKFTEPATHKLKSDVRVLYKRFVQLYELTVANLATTYVKAADNFFSAAADNLVEYLKTGVEQELPNNWITAVQTTEIFGEKVVVAMGGELADPDEMAEQLRKEFLEEFPMSAHKITRIDEKIARYVRMKFFEGAKRKDIADQYMQDMYPKLDPLSEEYKKRKRVVADMLDHAIPRAERRLGLKISDNT